MNYQEAISYIHSVEWMGSRPGLTRIKELLSLLGNPEKNFQVIHVAGTNGKGSFCAMLETILRAAGYKTGLFTSPYIEHFEERIRVGGENIKKDELADIVEYVSGFCKKMSDLPTEFELISAIGFEYFKRKKVDIAVVECGMGGRLDSTNVFENPILSVITGISLDHTQFLGNTIEEIAKEKAGIIKSNVPVLYGGTDLITEKIIHETAKKNNCLFFKKDISKLKTIEYSLEKTVFSYKNYSNISLSLLGTYQPENAASVIEAYEILKNQGLRLTDDNLRTGLSNVKWKGRFELLQKNPTVIFDGAHNEEGVSAAVTAARLYFKNTKAIVISGVMRDKNYKKIASEISKIAKTVFTVAPDNPRAIDAVSYANEYLSLGINAVPCQSFDQAVSSALDLSEKQAIPILCMGSLYSYAQFKNALLKY